MAFPPTHPTFARALAERDYNDPTEVQTAVLTAEASGRDLLVSAQTGSGKTVAFGLAFGATLMGDNDTLGVAGEPLALVIAPTRELALQVERELTWLYQYAGARIVACAIRSTGLVLGAIWPRSDSAAPTTATLPRFKCPFISCPVPR